MGDVIDSARIAKDIIFLESDSSRGMDVEEWETKILSRYPVLQERVARAAGWIQALIAEAVAHERERCATVAESYFPVFAQYAADLHGEEIAAAIRAKDANE